MALKSLSSVNARKFRTTREKVYFFLIVIASLGVWGWLLFSVWTQFKGTPLPLVVQTSYPDITDRCFVKNSYPGYGNILRIPEENLLSGEHCLTSDELLGEECFLPVAGGQARKVDFGELYTGDTCLIISDLTDQQKETARGEYASRTSPTSLGTSVFSKFTNMFSSYMLLLVFFVFGLFFHLIAMAHIRINAIKIGPNQFPELFDGVKKLTAILGMKKQPDVFVMNGNGILNAFAARLVFRRLLVIYSDLAEALIEGREAGESGAQQKQLEAVLAHELGHHELGHTSIWNYLIEPGMLVPLIGQAYSRAREYSCDRVMMAVIGDQEVCARALVKLAAGKQMGARANIKEYLEQRSFEGGFFTFLSEILSTHPHLPNRIRAIDISTTELQ
ncbi:MAG: M48 family metallopeptidase [bacterium]|nr:M48 family metallopeptidase [bacterium]